MNFHFSPKDEAFRAEVKTFLAEHLTQHLREGMCGSPAVFVEPDIGREWQDILHRRGWLAYNWPTEYGGTGWTMTQRYIFEKECAVAGAPALPAMGLKLLGPVICEFGTDDQRRKLLPAILEGRDYWCQGFSEPGSGSDLASLKTKAVRDNDEWVINGAKLWTTHAHHSTHMFCLARTNFDVKPQNGISFFLINLDQPGVEIRPIIGLGGDHEVNEVFLDNVRIPVANIVGEEGVGWTIAKFLLENERGGTCLAPKILADIEKLREAASGQADGYGGDMAQNTNFMHSLARVELEAQALEMTELRNLAELAEGLPPGPQTSLSKMIASSLRQTVALLGVRLFGYAGVVLETDRPLYGNNSPEPIAGKAAQLAMPQYLNSRACTIFGGTNEIQRNIIAKTVLGL